MTRTNGAVSPTAAWDALHQVVESNIDPLGMTVPIMHAQLAWLMHPQELSEAVADYAGKMLALQWHSWRRVLGVPSEDVERPNPGDTRFADTVWSDSAGWDVVKEWYPPHPGHALWYARPIEPGTAPSGLLVAKMAQRDGADQFSDDKPGCHAQVGGNEWR